MVNWVPDPVFVGDPLAAAGKRQPDQGDDSAIRLS